MPIRNIIVVCMVLSGLLPGLLIAESSEETWEGKIKNAHEGFIAELLASDDLAGRVARKWPGSLAALSRLASDQKRGFALDLAYKAMALEAGSFSRAATMSILALDAVDLRETDILRHLVRMRYGLEPATNESVSSAQLLRQLVAPGQASISWDVSYGRTVLAEMGHRWFQNGDFSLLRQAWEALASWAPPPGPSPENLPILEFAEDPDTLRFLFEYELASSGTEGSRNGFLLTFRYEANQVLTNLYEDLVTFRQFLADTRLSMAIMFGTKGGAPSLDPLATLPGSGDLEWLLSFKARVYRKDYGLAWRRWSERWAESKGTLFSRWRAMGAMVSDRDFAGIIKDVYNAGRLAGRVSATAAVLGEMANDLRGQARVYALELSARLYKALGDQTRAQDIFTEALGEASSLVDAGRLSLGDEQRILWYRLSQEVESGKIVVKNLAPWISKIRDKAYFADVFEDLFIAKAADKAWETLFTIYSEFGFWMTEDIAAKYAATLGRYYELENKRKASKTFAMRSRTLLAAAYDQHHSLYYHAMAAWFLGLDVDLAGVLERQSAGDGDLTGTMTARDLDEIALIRAMVSYGFLDGANNGLVAMRRSLPPAGLMAVAVMFAEAGQTALSVKFADYRRAYFDHPSNLEELELMYPRPYVDSVMGESGKRNVPWNILYSLLRTESFFDAKARSHAGAQGISQFMPATAKSTATAMGLESYDIFHAETGIAFSAFHLNDLLRRQKNWSRVLAAYNAGPGRMQREYARLPTDQFLINESLAIDETRNYIRRIIESSLIYEYIYHEKPDYHGLVSKFLKDNE